ncbi:MAG: hypothetical protein M0Z56_12215 [Desulfobacteraceae bacterium]|nr:hypothetical protein [Desulfobacteraceae bacterium]
MRILMGLFFLLAANICLAAEPPLQDPEMDQQDKPLISEEKQQAEEKEIAEMAEMLQLLEMLKNMELMEDMDIFNGEDANEKKN